MGRALSRYVPLDMAILGVIEIAVSFTVIHLMLSLPSPTAALTPTGLLAGAVTMSTHQGNELAAALALAVGGVTLIAGFRQPEICLDRRRLLGAACIAGIVAVPMFLLLSRGFVQGGTTARVLWLSKILGVWLATIALCRLLFSFVMQQTDAAAPCPVRRRSCPHRCRQHAAESPRRPPLRRVGRPHRHVVLGPAAAATSLGRRRRLGRRTFDLRTAAGLQAARHQGFRRCGVSRSSIWAASIRTR